MVEHSVHTRHTACIQLRDSYKGNAAGEHVAHFRYPTCINFGEIHNPLLIGRDIACRQHPIQCLVVIGHLVVLVILGIPVYSVLLVVCDVLVSPSDSSQAFGIGMTCPLGCTTSRACHIGIDHDLAESCESTISSHLGHSVLGYLQALLLVVDGDTATTAAFTLADERVLRQGHRIHESLVHRRIT